MTTLSFLHMGLLSLLFGCGSQQPYHRKGGRWWFEDKPLADVEGTLTPLNGSFAAAGENAYYRDARIPDGDGGSFEALSDHYAKDVKRVYYCDTYRDSKDYFSTKRIRILQVSGADPSSFRYIDRNYARDSTHLYFEGTLHPVSDLGSFTLLDYGFARDRATGYYMQEPIPGSAGASFIGVDDHYSKDGVSVFYSDLEPGKDGSPPVRRHLRLSHAQPSSFRVLGDGYAADSAQVYYHGTLLSDASSRFQVLGLGYAKSDVRVYYEGAPVAGADAASFTMLAPPTDSATARDAGATYLQGRRTPASSRQADPPIHRRQ